MPSIISVLSSLLLARAVLASPTPLPAFTVGSGDVSNLALPEGGLGLPQPDLALKYVLLGVGTQNYSCPDGRKDRDASPTATGAIADLYDLGPLLTAKSFSEATVTSLINRIPGLVLPYTDKNGKLRGNIGSIGFPTIGKHFFQSNPTAPVFDLTAVGARAVVGLDSKVPPPGDAFPGKKKEGAVDWLFLTDAGGSFGGVSNVYRVVTAGGKAPETCKSKKGEFTVEYAAEYWFYG